MILIIIYMIIVNTVKILSHEVFNKSNLSKSSGFHSHFSFIDVENKLKLSKWNKSNVENDLDRWTRFFKEGQELNDESLPEFMRTKEMRQAMAILRQISEKELGYDRYRRRINYIREQKSIQEDREAAEALKAELKQKLEENEHKLEASEHKLKASEQENKKIEKQYQLDLKAKVQEIEDLKHQLANKNDD